MADLENPNFIVELQVVVEDVRLSEDDTIVVSRAGNCLSMPGHPRIVPGEVLTITVARTGKIR